MTISKVIRVKSNKRKVMEIIETIFKVGCGKFPTKRLGRFLVVILKIEQAFSQGFFIGYIHRCQHIALDD